MKKIVSVLVASMMLAGMVGCSTTETATESTTTTTEATASATGLITVISREDGSGTRSAFAEITGVDDGSGDRTTLDAVVQDSTGKVMTAVAADPQALGYISLGSLNDTVKALTVDGVEATSENILNGSYTVARPFNIAVPTGADLDPIAEELIAYIFTEEAQVLVEENGFIPVTVTTDDFASAQPSGTITVGGSTSVYPLMEKFIEAYQEINPNATINLEGVGSSSGMNGATEGTFDVGMASRELKSSELEVLTNYVVAMDGIALVVNNENALSNLSMEQIMNIYIGEITLYDQL